MFPTSRRERGELSAKDRRRRFRFELLEDRIPLAADLYYSQGQVIRKLSDTGLVDQQLFAGGQPQISPDGNWLAFRRGPQANPLSNDLWVRNLQTNNEYLAAPGASGGINAYAFTPDSQDLIFDYNTSIQQFDFQELLTTTLVGSTADDAPSIRLSDGQVVVKSGTFDGLAVYNATLTTRTLIPNTNTNDNMPTWSPDGVWIAFQRTISAGVYEHFKIKPDGTGLTKLTSSTGTFALSARQGPAAWSYDGTKIYVPGSIGGVNGVYSVPTDGSIGTGNVTATLIRNTGTIPEYVSAIFDPSLATVSTTVSLSSSSPSVDYGVPLTFTATVTPAAGSLSNVGSVTFFVDGTQNGTVPLTGNQAVLNIPKLLAGSHTIQATFNYMVGYAPSKGTITQFVTSSPLPTGPQVAFSMNNTIHIAALDGSSDTVVTSGEQPVLSRDGRYLAFHRGSGTKPSANPLLVRDLRSGVEWVASVASAGSIVGFDWTVDGNSLTYDFAGEIRTTQRDVQAPSSITTSSGFDDAPAVNPVTGRLAIHNDQTGGIFTLNSDGTSRTLIGGTQLGDYWPRWSPDGQWIVFSRWTTTKTNFSGIFKINPSIGAASLTQLTATTGSLTLSSTTAGAGVAAWSPDGNSIIVGGRVAGVPGIYTFTANPTGPLTISAISIPTQIEPEFTHVIGATRAATQTTLTSSVSPSSSSGSVTFTATVTSASGPPTGSVLFKINNGTSVTASLDASGRAAIAIPSPPAGTLLVSAQFLDTATHSNSSASLNHIVLPVAALPAGNKLVYSLGSLIHIANIDGSGDQILTVGEQPKLSSDGRYLAFKRKSGVTNYTLMDLWVRDLTTNVETQIVTNTSSINGFDWTAAGQIVYDLGTGINRINRDGTGNTILSAADSGNDGPAVNPVDGRLAIWNLRATAVNGILVGTASGTGFTLLPNTVINDVWPVWSPDGQWLAFRRGSVSGSMSFYKIRVDGTGLTQLTSPSNFAVSDNSARASLENGTISWRDNNTLLASGVVNGVSGIYRVAADGSSVVGGAVLNTPTGNTPTFLGSVNATSLQVSGTITWIGTANGAWNTASNWSGGRVPGPGDNVVIPDIGTAGANLTITFNVPSVVVASITTSEILSLDGGVLTVTGNLSGSGTVRLNGGTLSGATVSSATTVNTGTLTGTTFAGELRGVTLQGTLTANARLDIAQNLNLTSTGVINIGSAGSLRFDSSQQILGNGNIVINNGSITSNLTDKYVELDVASGVTVRGGNGTIGSANMLVRSRGTIQADLTGQTLTIAAGNLTNLGTLRAQSSTLTISSPHWDGNGSLVAATGGTINLGGMFASASIANRSQTGGSYNLTGTLVNVGSTLSVNATTGPLNLVAGTILGGTISTTGANEITINTAAVGTLDGVTLNGTARTLNANSDLRILNNLVLNGSITTVNSFLTFDAASSTANQTVTTTSTAEIIATHASSDLFIRQTTSSHTVTFGPSVTLRGTSFRFGGSGLTGTWVNQGTIRAESASKGLTTFSGHILINSGTIQALTGSVLSLGSNVTNALGGSININAATLNLTGTITRNLGSIVTSATSTFNISGDWVNRGVISVTNTTVNLGGNFTQSAMGAASPVPGQGQFLRSGGTVTLVGTLTGDLTLDANTGPWFFGINTGGTLRNSRLQSTSDFTSAGSFTFDNVTIAAGTNVQMQGSGSYSLTVVNGLTIDGTLRVGVTGSNVYSAVTFTGTTTVGGTGSIVFGDNAINVIRGTAGTITFGPGLTIRGRSGTISNNPVVDYVLQGKVQPDVAGGNITVNGNNFTNLGRMEPTAGSTITISSSLTFTNNGQMAVSAGNTLLITPTTFVNANSIVATGGSLTLGGDWSNTGSISVTNTAVSLAGSFTQFGMGAAAPAIGQGTFIRSGGTVNLSGSLTGNLTLSADTGPWTFGGTGTMRNGTITSNSEFRSSAGYTFDNVTIASGTIVRLLNGGNVLTSNGLTIHGELRIGEGTTSGALLATNTQTIGGSGSVSFADNGANTLGISGSGITVTIGSGILLSGKSGRFTSTGTGHFILDGRLQPNVSGGSISVTSSVTSFTVNGRVEPTNGSTITFGNSTFTNNGTMLVSATNSLLITPTTFSNSNTGSITATGGALTLGGTGAWSNTGSISVSSTTVNLGGQFTQFALGAAAPALGQGTFLRSGGTINLAGTLTGDLTLNNVTGPWTFGGTGGVLRNSTLISSSEFRSSANFTFDNVNISSGTFVRVNHTLSSLNALIINGELRIGEASTTGRLEPGSTQTIGGSGSIVFADSTTNTIATVVTGFTVTLGSNLTLRGRSGRFSGIGTSTFINQGLIQTDVSGGSLTIDTAVTSFTNAGRIEPINGSTVTVVNNSFTNNGTMLVSATNSLLITPTTFSNSNTGSITATGGALTLGGTGAWSNTGSISVSSTTVNLGGQFTQFALGAAAPAIGQGTFLRSGGTVNLAGTLTGDLTLNNVTGPWTFGGTGGVLRNSTLTSSSEFRSSANFTFDNVNISSGTFVRVNHTLSSLNALIINGELRIGEASTTGRLEPGSTQTIGGSGSIVFADSTTNTIATVVTGFTVTLGSNLTLRGRSGRFSGIGTSTFINQGLIQTDVSGGSLTIDTAVTSFTNAGRIEPINGSTITVVNNSFTNNGTLVARGSNTIDVRPITFTNFTNSVLLGNASSVTLSGGSYVAEATATLKLYSGTTNTRQFRITELAADVTLLGAGARIVASGIGATFQNDALRDLASITSGGSLTLLGGSSLDPLGAFTNAGTLLVDSSSRFGSKANGPLATTGLVSSYAAENNANDGTGSNHGTLLNGATFGSGIVGQAFSLDGVDDVIRIPDSTSLRPTSLTVETWFQVSTAPVSTAFIISKPSTSGSDVSYSISLDSTSVRLGYNATSVPVIFTPAVGVWYHVALTFDDATDSLRLYLDGVERTSVSLASITYTSFPVLIGAGQTSGGVRTNFFTGKIDEVRVLNRALSATEIRNEVLTVNASRITQSGGTTTINGTATSQDQYSLAGGTLKGNGALSTPLNQTGGTLAPGSSPGCMTINGNYTLASAGSLQIEVDGPTACTQYDRLVVNGTVNLAGSLSTILAPAYVPTVGTEFLILDNDGTDAISGTFAGLPERQIFVSNTTQIFQISYVGGTGNDVTLKYLGSGFVVTTNAATGAGSLSDAITSANNRAGSDLIAFSLPVSQFNGGTYSILQTTNLPQILDALRIDATTQREYVDRPVIELVGAGSGIGLSVASSNSSIRGLSLTGWTTAVNIAAGSATLTRNYIGLKPDGTIPTTRNTTGIAMTSAANLTTIGGTLVTDRNIVSGNSGFGIDMDSSLNSSIIGNYIGTDPSGQQARANTLGGIRLLNGSGTPNTIGGSSAGSGNLISGNTGPGIELNNSDFQLVLGNTIGLNADGSSTLPNGIGVLLSQTAQGNRIGGLTTASRNVISGNATAEIQLTSLASGNEIWGNYIGTNPAGTAAMSSSSVAISINNASGNFIGSTTTASRNVIVGPVTGQGIGIQIVGANNNRITNNWLGVDAAGTTPLGYFTSAISLQNSDQTLIGTTQAGTGNVLVQYSSQAIAITGGSDDSEIYNNLIGIAPSGMASMFSQIHDRDGIVITGSSRTTVGGNTTATSLSNFFGGNRNAISINGATSIDNQIENNRIGLGTTGIAIPNTRGIFVNGARNTTIGTVEDGMANIISGNNFGVVVTADSFGTLVSGNLVGTSATGSTSPGIPNTIQGILIDGGTRTVVNDNRIVRTGTAATPGDNQGVRIATGDAVLRRNLIYDNLGASISVASPPGVITLTQARIDGFALGTITNATPNTAFTLEFFASTNPGQAEQYIGTSAVVTEADGTASFEIGGLGDLPPAKYLTATITGARIEGNDIQVTSALSAGVIPTSAIIRGLPSRGPEGRPISLKAFAVGSTITGYAVTGYLWQIKKDGNDFARGNEAGIQFAPDDEGIYTVTLTLTQTNAAGDVQLVTLGPHTITIENVAPTPQFEITPNAVRVGQPVTLTSNSSDPGLLDVLRYAWEVRSGSPTGPIVFSQAFSSDSVATQFQFTPTSGGIYYAILQVDDNDGGPTGIRTLTRQLEVLGLAQSIDIVAPTLGSEGQTVRARAPESELKRAEQLNFAWRVEKRTNAGAIVDANYPFTVPSRGVVEFIPNDDGRYRIFLTVTEAAGGAGSVVATPVDVTVTNTSPVVSINGPTTASLGGLVTLTANISEPRTVDTFTTTWVVERNGQPMPGLGQVGTPDTTFTFTPTIGGVYAITAVATDDDFVAATNVGRGSARRLVFVPESNLSVTVNGPAVALTEGQPATFTPVISGGTPSSYQWSVHDAQGRNLTALGQSGNGTTVPNFVFTPPQGGRYMITLSVVFADSRTASGTFTVSSVVGRAPTIDLLSVISPPSNVIITEGMNVTVRASASDAGEPRGLLYRWQLQRPGQGFIDVDGDRRRPTDLVFIPEDDGNHVVRVFVTDSEGNTVQSDLTIAVANALPTARLAVVGTAGNNVTLQAIATDPGSADQPGLTYAWSVSGGAFVTTPSNLFTTSITSPTSIIARVTDDTGSSFARYYFLVGTSGNDTTVLTAADVSAAQSNSADVLAFLALAGDDQVTVDASVTMPVLIVGGAGNDMLAASAATVATDLDGGDDNDTLIGGSGNDVLRAGSGTNILIGGNGKNRFVGGGNDTMTGGVSDDTYEIHFSTVVVNDPGDGIDTIDLTAAPAGVTLDFSATSGQAQSVFPTSTTSDPYHNSTLALNGTFTNLIGSPFGDALSVSTDGVSVDGGQGNDQIAGSGASLNLEGGLGNDTLVLTGAAGTLSGGPGNDTILGTLVSSSPVIIDSGDGDDTTQVSGPVTGDKASITYYGGSGNNTLTASRVKGKTFAGSGDTTNLLGAFGAETTATSLDAHLTNASDMDIFGAVSSSSQIDVTNSQDIDIFGGGSDTIHFNQVTRGNIDGGLFGARTGTPTLNADVSNSSDIDIFGAISNSASLNADVSNSSDIDIFGGLLSNDIEVYSSQDVDIFGVGQGRIVLGSTTTATVTRGSIHLSNFGALSSNATLNLAILNASDIDIFGGLATNSVPLNADVSNSSDIDIFGANARGVDIDVTNSSDVDIFGVRDGTIRFGPTTPGAIGNGVRRASIDASGFGAGAEKMSIDVTNSSDIDIFGSRFTSGAEMLATVTNSSDIDIFGSIAGNGSIDVDNSSDIDIFSQASRTVKLTRVTRGAIFTSLFGATSVNSELSLSILDNSSDIDIFGSVSRNADIEVTNSSDIDIFGGSAVTVTSTGTLVGDRVTLRHVTSARVAAGVFGALPVDTNGDVMKLSVLDNSSDIDIFGSAYGTTDITVILSQDIDIYGGFGDRINLQNASRVRMEGGVFGTAVSGQFGLSVTVQGNSQDIAIFGSQVADSITLTGGTRIGMDLREGNDVFDAYLVNTLVAITDVGDDMATINSVTGALVYMGAGRDRAQVISGTNLRILGAEDDDDFYVSGGTTIDIDGGNGNDLAVITGGNDVVLRADDGNDLFKLFQGASGWFGGGAGDETLQFFGGNGNTLPAGQVFAVLDGQAGNDTLEVRPLLTTASRLETGANNPLTNVPSWMLLPASIVSPERNTLPSSVALVGGSGNDTLTLEGNQRLIALGGDGNDQLRILAGHRSGLAGGAGDDTIVHVGSGVDNYLFGDEGNDQITLSAGLRTTAFGDEGNDTFIATAATYGVMRGGQGNDTFTVSDGSNLIASGETGDDTLTTTGGFNILSAGGPGDDQLTVSGGTAAVLLGEFGDDQLSYRGGAQAILSGGEGDDVLDADRRDVDLYGDDGDDVYKLKPITVPGITQFQLRVRELQSIDPTRLESESRGSDTLDLSAFLSIASPSGVNIDLGLTATEQVLIAGQLSLIMNGAFENVIGTPGNDTIIGSSLSNRLEGGGGNDNLQGLGGDDVLVGSAGDDTLQGGAGDDQYLFESSGALLGNDRIIEAAGGGTDWLNFSSIRSVGLGTLDLNSSATQALAGGLLGLQLIENEAPGSSAAEIEDVTGTSGNDNVLGNALDNRFELLGGDDTAQGGVGSDIYVFGDGLLGTDQVIEQDTSSGRDTLDFTTFGAPLTSLDLATTAAQSFGPRLSLSLSSGAAIENVVGSSFDDTILGNSQDNVLYGAAGADRLEGRAGNDRLIADLPSVVLLDFDSAFNAARGDYNYTTDERNAIQARMQADYQRTNWTFTQQESVARSLTADSGRSYVRLVFSEGRGGGVSGDAGEVDFRNLNRRIVSQVNVNPLLPTVRSIIGSNATTAQYSQAVVALSAEIASHELAHTAGVRHADAFGPIGSGVFAQTDTSRIYPPYSGPRGAAETIHHIISSPASVGTSIADALSDTYFGARESIKLAFAESGSTQLESAIALGAHSSIATAESLGSLKQLYVPNNAPSSGSVYSGRTFDVSALAVVGELAHTEAAGSTEVDYYRFNGRQGEFVNIELLANSIRPLRGAAFDGRLQIFTAAGQLIAENDDDLEGTLDATLMDVALPADGDYVIAVSLSTQPATSQPGGRYELFLSRFRLLPTGQSLATVVGDTLVGGPGSDTMRGGAADDLLLARDSFASDLADEVFGGGGIDTLDLLGLDYTYILATDHAIENIINANVAPTATLTGVPLGAVDEGSSFTISLTGATDPSISDQQAGFRYSYQLRTVSGTLISGGLSATYAAATTNSSQLFQLPDNGQYRVTARIHDVQNGFRDYTVDISSTNLAPTGSMSGPSSVQQGQPAVFTINANDVSTVDASSLRYGFATTQSALPGTYAAANSSNSGSLTFTGLGAQTAWARVFDKDGDSITLSLPVTVELGSMSLVLAGPAACAIGQPLTYSLTATQVPPGTRYEIDWGDGTTDNVNAVSGLVQIGHQYLVASGASGFTVQARAVATSTGSIIATSSTQVVVTALYTLIEGAQRTLFGGGTAGNETITVRRVSDSAIGVTLSATSVEVVYPFGTATDAIARLVLYGLAGNDTITVDSTLNLPVELYGGGGNDVLRGGAGQDILVGGDGNDSLYGNAGEDLLLGGKGRDTIYAQGDQDILIAGFTTWDQSPEVLRSILSYWTSRTSDSSDGWYNERVNALIDPSSTGTLGGKNFARTFDDNALDVLTAAFNVPLNTSRKPNVYFYNNAGNGIRDSAGGRLNNERTLDNVDES